MGQTAFLLVISVLLQDGRHLSALDTGLWLVPSGVFIVIGAQVGARLTRRIGTTGVVRAGLALEALGLGVTAMVIGPTRRLRRAPTRLRPLRARDRLRAARSSPT